MHSYLLLTAQYLLPTHRCELSNVRSELINVDHTGRNIAQARVKMKGPFTLSQSHPIHGAEVLWTSMCHQGPHTFDPRHKLAIHLLVSVRAEYHRVSPWLSVNGLRKLQVKLTNQELPFLDHVLHLSSWALNTVRSL